MKILSCVNSLDCCLYLDKIWKTYAWEWFWNAMFYYSFSTAKPLYNDNSRAFCVRMRHLGLPCADLALKCALFTLFSQLAFKFLSGNMGNFNCFSLEMFFDVRTYLLWMPFISLDIFCVEHSTRTIWRRSVATSLNVKPFFETVEEVKPSKHCNKWIATCDTFFSTYGCDRNFLF